MYFHAFAYDSSTGEETYINIPLSINVVDQLATPEPASALLLGLGALAAVGRVARRRD